MSKEKLCAGVVFYNPSDKEIKHLITYIDKVGQVYIYDNSSNNNYMRIKNLLQRDDFSYFWNGRNDGISVAFNSIASKANKSGFIYLLMLDQDSILVSEMIKKVPRMIKAYPNYYFYSLKTSFSKDEMPSSEVPVVVSFAITSGTIVDIKKFLEIGGYDENLFIDGVDRDFCYRVQENNLQILEFPNIILYQTLGNGKRNLFGIYEHNSLRTYYIWRNRMYVINKYPNIFYGIRRIKSLHFAKFRHLCSIIFCEEEKKEKISYIRQAMHDYRIQKFGAITKKR